MTRLGLVTLTTLFLTIGCGQGSGIYSQRGSTQPTPTPAPSIAPVKTCQQKTLDFEGGNGAAQLAGQAGVEFSSPAPNYQPRLVQVSKQGSDLISFTRSTAPIENQPNVLDAALVGDFFFGMTNYNTSGVRTITMGFTQEVDAASFHILDVDGGEIWTVQAKDSFGTVLLTQTINASSPLAGDARATPVAIMGLGRKIKSIQLTSNSTTVGFGIDNVSYQLCN